MATRRESDLYAPVKEFLTSNGFCVRGEVNDCDLVAMRNEDLIVVELKPIFNLVLVFQGIDRQALTSDVYLAVEAPQTAYRRSQWADAQKLCKRLGLGLLAVHFSEIDDRALDVEVVCEPYERPPRKNRRRKNLLIDEFQKRSGDYNEGGSPGGRLVVTAYRELALAVAYYLQREGPTRLRDLREAIGNAKVTSIVTKNYYQWFTRVERGVYDVTSTGIEALEVFADVVQQGVAREQQKRKA